MFCTVCTKNEYEKNKERFYDSIDDIYLYVKTDKIIDDLEKTITDCRKEYLKSPNKYDTKNGFLFSKKYFYDFVMLKVSQNSVFKILWDRLNISEYNSSIYPNLFNNSYEIIKDDPIDSILFEKEMKRLIKTNMLFLNDFQEAEKILINNKQNSLFSFNNLKGYINLFEINNNYNRYYSWENHRKKEHSFRSPNNIENIETIEKDDYEIHKLRIYRLQSTIDILWAKNDERSFKELMYKN